MLYAFTVIPRFTSQLVPKKGDVNRETTQSEVKGNKNLDDVKLNIVNLGEVKRRITVHRSLENTLWYNLDHGNLTPVGFNSVAYGSEEHTFVKIIIIKSMVESYKSNSGPTTK